MAQKREIKHGTRHAYMRRGCRCDECREVAIAYNRLKRERFAERSADEIGHGYGAYTNGCRCNVCKKAKADYMRTRRAAARAKAQKHTDAHGRHFVPGITHGRFGYEECGCRCAECMVERASSDRRVREGRAARAAT